jgi:hypothetical protein
MGRHSGGKQLGRSATCDMGNRGWAKHLVLRDDPCRFVELALVGFFRMTHTMAMAFVGSRVA